MKIIFTILIISAVQWIHAQKVHVDDFTILPQKYEETFNFIFKLDSLGLTKGKLNYLREYAFGDNTEFSKAEDLRSRFEKQNDSIYQVIIHRQKFTLNTLSGWVMDLKSGRSVYRNFNFRIAESHQSDFQGTDSLGNWTASYGGFKKNYVSNVRYEPKRVEPNKTVEYGVRHTKYADDGDSTWTESDTTRTTTSYDSIGRKQHVLIENYGSLSFPGTVEYAYTYSGDTCLATLIRFESEFSETTNGIVMGVQKTRFSKKLSTAENGTTHDYFYSERTDGWDLHATDTFLTIVPNGRIYVIQEKYEHYHIFPDGYKSSHKSHYKHTFTYTAK